jgi:hypothetical protein
MLVSYCRFFKCNLKLAIKKSIKYLAGFHLLFLGYFMPIRQLFDNFFSIMVFAVLGTVWNTLTIGATIALFGHWGFYTVKGVCSKVNCAEK